LIADWGIGRPDCHAISRDGSDSLLLNILPQLMPSRKRKERSDTISEHAATHTAPTLKEYMWIELIKVIKNCSTIPLSRETLASRGMKKFRWGLYKFGEMFQTHRILGSSRILTEWEQCIEKMDGCQDQRSVGDPVTPEELHRVVLTVALAISNPHEFPTHCSVPRQFHHIFRHVIRIHAVGCQLILGSCQK
jgi:hypothetical protein